MKKYFENCKTLNELKTAYRTLAKENHPDCGGSVEIMQEINRQYEMTFNTIKNDSEQEIHTVETASDFIQIINALMKIKGIKVELCGSWLWISGNTYRVRNQISSSGCRWSKSKKMWYWRPADEAFKPRRGNMDIDEIRHKYGSRIINGGIGQEICMA